MNNMLHWDPLLIQRYNRSGPRYTSYPTAIEFRPLAAGENENLILNTRDSQRPLSLYIHIPFCAHVCYYCGCNKIVTKDRSRSERYLLLLKQEIKMKAAQTSKTSVVEQMHFGGGTPTFLDDDQLEDLINFIRENFTFSDSDSADFSIEIDPRELRPSTLPLLKSLGFNRISFGIQDLDPEVQKAVNRIQPESMIRATMQQARELGFRSINMDLIYGLPHQTCDSFDKTLTTITELKPDRLSVFNYAHLPERFKPQRRINEHDLPDAHEKLAILGHCISTLTQSGYHYIGMDHFALPDDELAIAQSENKLQRNFQGYTTHGNCDLIGFGVSSISQVGDYFLQNPTDINQYESLLEKNDLPAVKVIHCHKDDQIRRHLIMSLLCHSEIRFDDLRTRFDIDAADYFSDEIKRLSTMITDELVEVTEEGIFILAKGRLLVRNVCMLFDSYLNAPDISDQNRPRFSKAI